MNRKSSLLLLVAVLPGALWLPAGCRREATAPPPESTPASESAPAPGGTAPGEEETLLPPLDVPADPTLQPFSDETYNPAPPRDDLPAAPPAEAEAPLIEGAQPNGLERREGFTLSSYVTDKPFAEVKEWYRVRLTEADGWRNDGVEASPFGTDEWEFVRETTGERVRIEAVPGMPTTVEIRCRR